MHRLLKALSLGIVTACLGVLVYFFVSGFELEEYIGLDLLFKLRGNISVPDNSVIVAIDKVSSDYFGLENKPEKWPRHYHTKLINTLVERGARIIVFDVFFKAAGDFAEDKALAGAIKKAGNVILFSQLKRQILSQHGHSPRFADINNAINIERLIYPTAIIAAAPVALAPFALLKYPQKISKFWTFRVPAGEIPNMPAIAFQLATLKNYLFLRQLIEKIIPQQTLALPRMLTTILQQQKLVELVSELRDLFKENPELGDKIKTQLAKDDMGLSGANKHALLSLLAMYQGPNQHYLNFYGPPRSITTIPYYEVIEAAPKTEFDFNGKVVFVGFSEFLQPEQEDNFYTVFSQKNGLDISGVEIAATAFSNLFYNQSIRTLIPFNYIGLIVLYGVLIAFICRYLHSLPSVLAAIFMMSGYALISYWLFSDYYLWLPWVVPLLIQSPFAIFVALVWHYIEARREHEQIRTAFGFYLPTTVVNRIAQNAGHLDAQQQQMYGICLATDAVQYTRLAEQMSPEQLSLFINRYYEQLFAPVRDHGGIISDVIGDAMLAIWSSSQSDVALRTQACKAALKINKIMNSQHASDAQFLLPTRIGLHAGELMLGNVGAIDHFEYRAVGDIVNTSNRIENLNKRLGSQLIASENAVEGVEGIIMRPLGRFRLAGKQQALTLFELLCHEDDCTDVAEGDRAGEEYRDIIKQRCDIFSAGLAAFQTRDWEMAKITFSRLIDQYNDDKPAQFYLQYCELMDENKLSIHWDGTIELDEK